MKTFDHDLSNACPRFLETVLKANPHLQPPPPSFGAIRQGYDQMQPIDEPLIRFNIDAHGSCELPDDARISYELTEAGLACHYLRFLIHTSNFTWRKQRQHIEVTPDENQINNRHLLSKLCAIGYLLSDTKHYRTARAVIATDQFPQGDDSSGTGSGKTLFGSALATLVSTVRYECRTRLPYDGKFTWEDVTDETQLVILDDVAPSFKLNGLYPFITDDWDTPKLYITSCYRLKGTNASTRHRLWNIIFSDYYNIENNLCDDFGGEIFFRGWKRDQWTLFCNLMANCLQLYIDHGFVHSPGKEKKGGQP